MDLFACMSTYVQVVEKQSFQRAAEARNVTPSYISKQVSWLEGHLGAKLLQRTTRRLNLTEIGALYYEQCVQVLRGVEKSENIIKNLQGEVSGNLRINAPLSFGITHLSKAVADFNLTYPNVSTDIYLSDDVVDIVGQGFDIGIRVSKTLSDSSLIARELSPGFKVRACAAPAYLDKFGAPVHPRELSKHNCLVYSRFKTTSHHWTFRGPEGDELIKVDGSIRTNNTLFLREAILRGVGIGMIGSYGYSDALKQGRLVTLFENYQAIRPSIYGLYPSREYLPLKTSVFLKFLKDWLAQNLD